MMQVEESFMQQVVMHWQGSAAAAANTPGMQSDQQALTYGGPPDPSVSQVDRQGGRVGPQAADATSLSSEAAETREPPVAGNHQLQVLLLARTKQWYCLSESHGLPFSKPWSSFSKQCYALQQAIGLLFSRHCSAFQQSPCVQAMSCSIHT